MISSHSIEYAKAADNLAQVSRCSDEIMDGWVGVVKGLADKCRIMADEMDKIVTEAENDR
jgi:hypothetical protein